MDGIEPLYHDAEVLSAAFSPLGQQIVTASHDKTARVWEVPTVPVPVPEWLPSLTEGIAEKRFNDQGILEAVPMVELQTLKRRVTESSASDVWTRWAKWFFADPATRTISPFSDTTVREYVRRRIEEDTFASLQEAVRLSPTNGLAFARLAFRVLEQDDKENPRRVGEADFYSRYAVRLAPNDQEVLKIRAEIQEKVEKLASR
jgi:hypothetical protein